jgi:hypothetical protein
MIKQIGLLTLVINVQLLFAQTNPDEFITKKAALQDISILKTSIFEIHPSTFRYTSKVEFNDEFTRATNRVADSIKIIEFANLIVPIKDSLWTHLSIDFVHQLDHQDYSC